MELGTYYFNVCQIGLHTFATATNSSLLCKWGTKLRFPQADVKLILIPINCLRHSTADCVQ